MNVRLILALATFFLLPLAAGSLRAENLGQILEEAELGALIGTWVDEDSNGDAITLTYTWRIENHALSMHVKTPNRTSEALIRVDPKTGDVLHSSVDDKGGVGQGSWGEENGVATLTLKIVDVEEQEMTLKVTHRIVDNKALEVGYRNADTNEGGDITLVRKAE